MPQIPTVTLIVSVTYLAAHSTHPSDSPHSTLGLVWSWRNPCASLKGRFCWAAVHCASQSPWHCSWYVREPSFLRMRTSGSICLKQCGWIRRFGNLPTTQPLWQPERSGSQFGVWYSEVGWFEQLKKTISWLSTLLLMLCCWVWKWFYILNIKMWFFLCMPSASCM